MGCHVLLQAIFPTQESNPRPLHLLHWQADSLPLVPPGEPSSSLLAPIPFFHSLPHQCQPARGLHHLQRPSLSEAGRRPDLSGHLTSLWAPILTQSALDSACKERICPTFTSEDMHKRFLVQENNTRSVMSPYSLSDLGGNWKCETQKIRSEQGFSS